MNNNRTFYYKKIPVYVPFIGQDRDTCPISVVQFMMREILFMNWHLIC